MSRVGTNILVKVSGILKTDDSHPFAKLLANYSPNQHQ
jgi:hypothetical protein